MLGAYVTRSIFQERSEKTTSRASIELLKIFKKQFFRPPTVICLVERTEDNLIHLQAAVKKRLRNFQAIQVRREITFSYDRLLNCKACSRSEAYTVLFVRKGQLNSKWLIAVKPTESASWSTMVVKPSKHSERYHPRSNTRRERRPSPNKHLSQMYEFSKTALPEQTTATLRAEEATRGFPNGYRVI